jgi:hypothetical protein
MVAQLNLSSRAHLIQDYQPIIWHDHYIKETFEIDPGLYDDIYIDMTFVEILEKYGLDAPCGFICNQLCER